MPKAVLEGLKQYPDVELSVISAMLDSGGSAGRERKEPFNTKISFGDIRRASYALAQDEEKDKYNARITSGTYKGHVLSNLSCSYFFKGENDYEKTIGFLNNGIFKIPQQHQVLPATLDDAELCAELENGEEIEGETKIDILEERARPKIKHVYLKPATVKAYPKAKEVIKKADLIVIGPGDLYSSLAQILLVQGMSRAIRKSKAKKTYICNLMTKNGETNNFSVLDLADEIEKYLESSLDYVIYNNKDSLAKERIEETKKENPNLIDLIKTNDNLPKDKFIGRDLLFASGPIIHDPQKLAKVILSLCKQ